MSRWNAQQHALLEALGVDWPRAAGTATAESAGVERPRRVVPPSQAEAEPEAAAPAGQPASMGPAPVSADSIAKPMAATTLPDLEAVASAVRACQACGLCQTRKQAVPGVGHPQAQWMVVGEGPGEQEDAQGEPFVGRSGQLLDDMLGALGLGRQDGPAEQQVFIANTVKCRPPGNRNPSPEELAACAPFLRRQLELVKPRVVLALGRYAAQALLNTEAAIGSLRRRVHRLPDGTPVVVSYHPAYLLRQPLEKARAWEDLCLAAQEIQAGAA